MRLAKRIITTTASILTFIIGSVIVLVFGLIALALFLLPFVAIGARLLRVYLHSTY